MESKETKRHYYGLDARYGIRTISEGDKAYRFGSKAERDAWVEADPWPEENAHREATNLEYIRRHKLPILEDRGDWELRIHPDGKREMKLRF